MLSVIVEFMLVALSTVGATMQTPDDLHNQYYTIFPSGNRNAASHRWATYVLERSQDMTAETFRMMFSSFCAVSGSPVYPSPQKRWQMTLPQVTGGQDMTGMMYFCCAPCVCDTYDFIKVDTKTITTRDGPKQYYFVVIGNPCLHPEALTQTWTDVFSGVTTSLQQAAPDVKCQDSGLEKATLSDNGHIILSMFFESDTPGHGTADGFSDSNDLKAYCEKRAETGYASGMGEIFRKVAVISPLGNLGTSYSSDAGPFISTSSKVGTILSTTGTTIASTSSTTTSPTTSSSLIETDTTSTSIASSSSASSEGIKASKDSPAGKSTTSSDVDQSAATPSTTESSLAQVGSSTSDSRNVAVCPMIVTCFVAVLLGSLP